MSTKKTTTKTAALTVLPPDKLADPISKDFDLARKYWRGSMLAAGAMAYGVIMMGLELTRLHKLYGVRAGRPKADNSRTSAVINWPELVQREMGFSDDTARRYMMMADVAKTKIKALRDVDVLNKPILSQSEHLMKAVAKIADGETVKQLMIAWGIVKKPSGGKGGGAGRPEDSKDTRTEAQKANDAMWPVQDALGNAALKESFEADLLLLPDRDPGGEQASLEGLESQLETWLKAVRHARDHHKKHRKEARA